jgi:tRNA threonylcarbamoyl adenosine modification protein YeaZ
MVKILSFNTTDKFINLMLQEDSQIVYKKTIEEKNKHSELLIPEIENILKKFNISYKNLDCVSTIKGPGNFMGLRSGISVAKAIDISTKVPIITMDIFELALFPYKNKKEFVSVIKANLNNYYIKQYTNKPLVLNYEDLLNFILNQEKIKILTNDEKLLKLKNSEKFNFIFDNWAKLIYKKFINKEFDKNIEPLYIRSPKITPRKVKK